MLQRCPAQWKALLNAIGAIDSIDTSLLFFYTKDSEPRLPHTIVIHIFVCYMGKNFNRTVLDEGTTTYIMCYSCWKALGSPMLATSKTVLKAFDGHLFTPHGILVAFPVELGGKRYLLKWKSLMLHLTIISP